MGIMDLFFKDTESAAPATVAPKAAEPGKATPTPAPVRRTAPAVASATVAPDDIRAAIDEEFETKAAPAYGLLRKLMEKFKGKIADPATRVETAALSLEVQGYTPDHVLFDIDECIAAADKLEGTMSGERDAVIRDVVGSKETERDDCNSRADTLEAEARALREQAKKADAEARESRANVEANFAGVLQYIGKRREEARADRQIVAAAFPTATPQPPSTSGAE